MPHVYIVTVGPGSNGTTASRAVSYKRIGIGALDVESGQADGSPGLVADVDLQQDGGEGLDRRGGGQGTGVDGAEAGHLGNQLCGGRDGVGVVATDQDVALQDVVQVRQRV